MRIILYELRKIWNLKMVISIIAFSAMFYLMFMHFFIIYYPNGHPATEDAEMAILITERYGSQITPEELDEFYAMMHPDLVRQVNAILKDNAVAREKGITDYASLLAFEEHMSNNESEFVEDEMALASLYEGLYENYVLFKLSALDGIKNRYEVTDEDWNNRFSGSTTDLSLRRWHEVRDTEEGLSVIPWSLMHDNLNVYVMYLSFLVVITVIILHSPLITSERLRNMRLLQYSSKSGRGLLGKQLSAVVLSSAILTTVLLLVFGGLYSLNGTHIFWNNYVSSFNSFFISSLPLTYGQYVIALVVMLYLLGISVSAITFLISRLCSNYIPLVASGICTGIVVIILCTYIVFEAPFNRWIYYVEIALFEPLILAAMVLVSFISSALLVRREREIDIA